MMEKGKNKLKEYFGVVGKLFLSLAFLLGAVEGSWAQSQRWIFGNVGIRFDQPAYTPTLFNKPSVPMGSGGSTTVLDPLTGTVLFYTDGNTVYDINNLPMPNGGGLLGNALGNMPSVVCPVPGQPNQYYVFTNDASYGTAAGTIRFSIVDMSQFGNAAFPLPPTGSVTVKNQGIPGLTGRAEGMTIIPHSNGTDFWLITQESGTSNYTVTQIGPGGTFTSTTYSGLGYPLSAAAFAFHAGTNKLAVAPQDSKSDVVILGFDPATGALSFNQFVLNTGVNSLSNQAIYDVEWSPNGNFLYVSTHGESGIPANVYQYDLSNPLTSLTSVLPQPNSIFGSYGLQMGPDSAIYHLYQAVSGGPILMGKISNPDTVATSIQYVPQAFPGTGFPSKQFPSVNTGSNANPTATFTSSGTCANAPSNFFPTVTPGADSLLWDFGDGTTSNQWSPVHTYQNGGAYPVTVTAYLNGKTTTFTQNVNITQFNLQINLAQDTTACSCELPFPKAVNPPPPCTPFQLTAQVSGGTPSKIEWFGPSGLLTTQTTTTLKPDSAGFYYIKAFDASGCYAYAGVNIKEYGVMDPRANVWYFGQNAGIDFNTMPVNPPAPISNPVMNAPQGTSIICDRNGQVIFFTDGSTVWDRNFNVLATNIGGDPNATQPALIMPVPGDETLYYIFTTQAVSGGGSTLKYSLYDLKIGTFGSVVQQGTALFPMSTENLASNGTWLLAHEWGNNNFLAYQVTPNGINSPVISSSGSDHAFSPPQNGQGTMKFGPQNQVAVTLSTPGVSNVIELFDFANLTGVVSNPRVLDLNSATGQVYGLEFSPGGNKLFATLRDNGTSYIYEYAIDSLGNATFLQKQAVPGNVGAMQIGPDGQIYVAVNGSNTLLTIIANEDITQLTPLNNLQPFALASGTSSTSGLPNFVQNIASPIQGPSITVTGFCLGSPTQFFGTGTDNIDKFQWFFGDGAGATTMQATHTYAAAGNYVVSLRITNRCGLDTTLVQTITIVPPPANPTFLPPGATPVLCTGNLVLEATPLSNPTLPNLSFLWSTGDTTRTITVNQQGIYGVTITNAQGCTSSGNVLIADNRPILNLSPNQTLCQNTVIFPLDAQNPGNVYAWTINGVASGAAQTQSVDTSLPGVFEYEVTVTDPITTCTVKDSTIYTIKQSPVFTVAAFNTTACGANNGRIELNITAPATSLFTYSIVGPSSVMAIDKNIGLYTTTPTLLPGTYGVVVADQVSGCATITTATVNDNAFVISSVVRQTTCDPLVLRVTHTASVFPYTYRVINAATAQVAATGSSSGTPFFDTPGVPSGSYIVEMTSGGCTATLGPLNFVQDPVTTFVLSANPCANPITVTATAPAGSTFVWTGANITSAKTLATITATPPQGLQQYKVTVSTAGFCPAKDSIMVNVNNNVIADFTLSSPCADQVTLTASPMGAYTYRWYRAGVLVPGGQQITVGLFDNGISYKVDVVNSLSGCVFPSPVKAVQVSGGLSVSLATTFPCEGSPFTLTANVVSSVALPAPTFAWQWNGNPLIGGTNTLTDTRGGDYKVIVSRNTCSAQGDITIIPAPVTPGLLPSRAIICNDPANTDPATNKVLLDPGPSLISYDWFKDGVSLGVTTQTYLAMDIGLYRVDLVNSYGCASSDKTQVELECEPKITGPNAFRPGGVNTDFYLFSFFVDDADFQVFVFNRWGEMVFQSNDRNFKWNGGYNNVGPLLPPGMYAYVVRYKSSFRPEEGIKEKRGGVLLLR